MFSCSDWWVCLFYLSRSFSFPTPPSVKLKSTPAWLVAILHMQQCGDNHRAPTWGPDCLAFRVGYHTCADGSVWTTWFLMPVVVLNFSLATVCLTMSEISLACHCGSIPFLSWPQSSVSDTPKISCRLIVFWFIFHQFARAHIPDCDSTYVWCVSHAVSRCCHVHGNKET